MLATIGAIVGVIVAIVSGLWTIVVAIALVSLVAAILSSGSKKTTRDKFPDERSNYNRRVWASDHNYEADGDTDHNYEADGDTDHNYEADGDTPW